jgi:branched-chain amino acid aminotransferase
MTNTIFLNNKFVDPKEATVSILDLGFLRGYGVFDFAIARKNNIFALDLHVERLRQSSEIINLELSFSLEKINQTTQELVEKNGFDFSTIRWILTGGITQDGKTKGGETFVILVEEAHEFPEGYYTQGVKVKTLDSKRQIPEAKTLDYQFAYANYQKMEKENIFEGIYTPNNEVLEGFTSNVFIVKNGELITPAKNILFGITRKKIIEIAKANNIPVIERIVKKDELLNADEVFITATLKQVMPVTEINSQKVGDGTVGEITKKLIGLFKDK